MSKIKNFFHDQISDQQQPDTEYGVTSMLTIQRLTEEYTEGKINAQAYILGVILEVKNFENMHTPTKP
jgi:hypothetical protein